MWRTYTITHKDDDETEYSDAVICDTLNEAHEVYGMMYTEDDEEEVFIYEFIRGNTRYVFRKEDD